MSFIILIFFTAFAMETIGSYVSVVGLGSLFAGDAVILSMAVILDVAKVVSVSFLYQYWEKIKSLMRYYMLVAVTVLMTITSAGAFGYLSGAFQKALQPNMEVMLKVESMKRERDQLVSEREQLIKQRSEIDRQIAQLPSESVKGRRQLIASFKPEKDQIAERSMMITKRIDELNVEVLKVESQNIDQEVHVGPITYVSKIFGITVEESSKWIILTIIFVFDPLAVILIIAGNFLIKLRKEEQRTARKPIKLVSRVDSEPPDPIKLNDEIAQDSITQVEPEAALDIPIDEEIKYLQENVYDDIDRGEDVEFIEEEDSRLKELVQRYIPVVPEVKSEEPVIPPLSLESVKVALPSAFIREGVITPSSKRSFYEKQN